MTDQEQHTVEPVQTGRHNRPVTSTPSSDRHSLSLSRTRSRPSRPSSPQLSRLYSHHFLDDHNVYNHEHAAGENSKEKALDTNEAARSSKRSSDLEEDQEKAIEAEEEPDEIPEGPFGLPADDPELGDSAFEKKLTTKSTKDPNLVTWDGPDDPKNPKNWTNKQKWAATLVVSSFTLISPVSSSMVAPAIASISADFHITNSAEEQLVLSIFVLAYAVGPLFLGPLSELYGRIRVLQLANAFYFVFNLACGFAQNKGEMMAFRFLSGLGGSAPLAIGGGLLSDCWKAEERGRAIAIYSLAPLLGPAIGPIAGAYISEYTTWRWTFWATSIACFCIQVSGVFFLQETYTPELLKRKKNQMIKQTGNNNLHTEFDDPNRTFSKHLRTALIRPFRLLGTQSIVQALAIYMAYVYGLMYLVLSTFPRLWTDVYGESVGTGGLNYISLGLGFFLGTQIGAPLNDSIYRRLKAKNGGVGRSEFRVPLMVPGSILMPIGLFWYGWSAQARMHWIMPDIGAVIFSMGTIMIFQSCQTYIIDAYTRFAASAIASATVLRSLAGFGFPLFAPAMYEALGYGWGNTVLGIIAIVLGIPAPILLWFYGEKLRSRSKYAAGS